MNIENLNVVLHGVGNNLNRAYRTVEFFGGKKLLLHDCNKKLSGALFKAAGRVRIDEITHMPAGENVVYFETNGKQDITNIDWGKVDTVCFGGETNDFISKEFSGINKVRIPGYGASSGLTVEASVAIVLNHITNNVN